MQNGGSLKKERSSWTDSLRQNGLYFSIFVFLSGFFCAGGGIFLRGAGIGLISGSRFRRLAALLGYISGIFFGGFDSSDIKYMAAGAAVYYMEAVISYISEDGAKHIKRWLCAMIALICGYSVELFFSGFKSAPLLSFAVDLCLCGVSSVLFDRVFGKISRDGIAAAERSENEGMLFAAAFLILLSGAGGIKIFSFSPSMLLYYFAVLYCLERFAEKGVFLAVLAGVFSPLLSDPVAGAGAMVIMSFFYMMPRAVGIKKADIKLSCAAFLLACIFIEAVFSRNAFTIECSAAVVAFILLDVFFETGSGRVSVEIASYETPLDTLREGVEKLKLWKESLKMNDMTIAIKSVENSCGRVCRKCRRFEECWISSHFDTSDVMNKLTSALYESGHIGAGDVPKHFIGVCPKLGELLDSVNDAKMTLSAENLRRSPEEALTPELTELLLKKSREIQAETDKSNEKAAVMLRSVLRKPRIFPKNLSAKIDQRGKLNFEFSVDVPLHKARESAGKTLSAVSAELGKEFSIERINKESEKRSRVTVREAEIFEVISTISTVSKRGEIICGDTVSSFAGCDGRHHIIISDGMGSGPAAAVDSSMAVGLTESFLKKGVDAQYAVELINRTLRDRPGHEGNVTLDLASVDLSSGMLTLTKCGAAASILISNGKAELLECESLPLGILKNVCAGTIKRVLSEGDVLILISDGCFTSGGNLYHLNRAISTFDPRRENVFSLSKKILAAVKHENARRDDCSLAIAFIKRT